MMAKSSKPKPADPHRPSLALLAKLGSIAVHTSEFFSVQGHTVDRMEAVQLLKDPEVVAWIKAMGPLLPKRRYG